MKNNDNVVNLRNYFTPVPASDTEQEPTPAMDEVVDLGFGIPHCPCGQCVKHLINEHGAVLISMDSLKDWFKGICPKAA